MKMPFRINSLFGALLSHTSSIPKIHSFLNILLEDNDQAFFGLK